MRALLFSAWAALLLAPAADARPSGPGIPQAYVARPLALPEDLCQVGFLGGASTLDPGEAALAVQVGAVCGVTEGLEARLWVLRGEFSERKDAGLQPMLAGLRYRVFEGPLALRAGGHLRLSFGDSFGAGGELTLRGRLGRLALYLSPQVERLDEATSAAAPATLNLQLTAELSLIGRYTLSNPDISASQLHGRWGAGIRYSWLNAAGYAAGDASLMLFGPAASLSGAAPDRERYENNWAIELWIAPIAWMRPSPKHHNFDGF